MKYIITLSCLSFFYLNSKAQTAPNTDTTYFHEEYHRVFIKVEHEPTFKGGDSAWKVFQSAHLIYPEEARYDKIQGTVQVHFIVQPDGSLTDIEALTGPPKLRKAAIQLMKESPAWNPAKQNHFIVRAYKNFPIVFKLPEN